MIGNRIPTDDLFAYAFTGRPVTVKDIQSGAEKEFVLYDVDKTSLTVFHQDSSSLRTLHNWYSEKAVVLRSGNAVEYKSERLIIYFTTWPSIMSKRDMDRLLYPSESEEDQLYFDESI